MTDIDPNAEKVEITKEEHETLAKLPEVVKNMTAEMVQLRKDKADAEAARIIAEAKLTPKPDDKQETPEEAARRVLAERDADDRKRLRENAENAFKETHKEFHPDNDPGGLKYAAFQRHLARLNLDGARTGEDFASAFEDALIIMNKGVAPKKDEAVVVEGDPDNTGGGDGPKGGDPKKLSSVELSLIKELGWSEDRYLKVKTSRPGFVQKLITEHAK